MYVVYYLYAQEYHMSGYGAIGTYMESEPAHGMRKSESSWIIPGTVDPKDD